MRVQVENVYKDVREFEFMGRELFILTSNFIQRTSDNRTFEGSFFCIRTWASFLLTQNGNETNVIALNSNLENVKEINGHSNYALWLITKTGLIPVGEEIWRLNEDLNFNKTHIKVFPKKCNELVGIRRSKSSVFCDDYLSNKVRWTYDLEGGKKIEGDWFLLDSLVAFSTLDKELIGLNVDSGKQRWRLNGSNLFYQVQQGTNYLVSLAANTFGDNFFQVVDPLSGEMLITKSFVDFYYETTASMACVSSTHYYFVSNIVGDGKKTNRVVHIGSINLTTYELEWVHKIDQVDGYIEFLKPEYRNERLYLKDVKKTLYECKIVNI